METVPPIRELVRALSNFGDEHPALFRYRSEFRRQGVHIPVEYFPTSARVRSSHKTLPDLINLCGLGVSERFRAALEALEPGAHQFQHVPVLMKDGSPAPHKFYATVLGHVAEGQVEFVGSTKVEPTTLGYSNIEVPRLSDSGLLTINRKHTAGWHLWYSWDIFRFMTMSDEFKHMLDSIGVKCNDYIYLNETA